MLNNFDLTIADGDEPNLQVAITPIGSAASGYEALAGTFQAIRQTECQRRQVFMSLFNWMDDFVQARRQHTNDCDFKAWCRRHFDWNMTMGSELAECWPAIVLELDWSESENPMWPFLEDAFTVCHGRANALTLAAEIGKFMRSPIDKKCVGQSVESIWNFIDAFILGNKEHRDKMVQEKQLTPKCQNQFQIQDFHVNFLQNRFKCFFSSRNSKISF